MTNTSKDDAGRLSVVEMRSFDGENDVTWARFVLLPDGTIRVIGRTENDVSAADHYTARGLPGPRGTIVTRDHGLDYLRLLAENFSGSRNYATRVFEMDADDALRL
jgi:hypothetical protein